MKKEVLELHHLVFKVPYYIVSTFHFLFSYLKSFFSYSFILSSEPFIIFGFYLTISLVFTFPDFNRASEVGFQICLPAGSNLFFLGTPKSFFCVFVIELSILSIVLWLFMYTLLVVFKFFKVCIHVLFFYFLCILSDMWFLMEAY